MKRRTFVGGSLAALALAVMLTGATVVAQEEDQPAVDIAPVDAAPVADAPAALFLRIVDPQEELEVPLSTSSLTVRGETLPAAIVSVDGDLVDVGGDGTFVASVSLDPGANVIDVVASTEDGSVTDTSLLVIRGTD